MKFAHLADCHVGGWREPKLRELGLRTFEKAIDICVEEYVGFVLISGDLFDTALPSIDVLKETARILRKLREHDISCYIIPGSHDFSPSGRTLLDVFERAGLVENVMKYDNGELKFSVDRTGAKVTGMYGRKGGLESSDYSELKKEGLESEGGFKIFMFHTALDEFKPKDLERVECLSYQMLPRNFDYYAGGHVHYAFEASREGYKKIVFPGPLFPNNFRELEEFGCGRFCVVSVSNGLDVSWREIKLKEVVHHKFNLDGVFAEDVEARVVNSVRDFDDKILLLRFEGVLSSRAGDINFKGIAERLSSAYAVLKSTSGLKSRESKLNLDIRSSADVESLLMSEAKFSIGGQELAMSLMRVLDVEKSDGERSADFEARVLKEALDALLIYDGGGDADKKD